MITAVLKELAEGKKASACSATVHRVNAQTHIGTHTQTNMQTHILMYVHTHTHMAHPYHSHTHTHTHSALFLLQLIKFLRSRSQTYIFKPEQNFTSLHNCTPMWRYNHFERNALKWNAWVTASSFGRMRNSFSQRRDISGRERLTGGQHFSLVRSLGWFKPTHTHTHTLSLSRQIETESSHS